MTEHEVIVWAFTYGKALAKEERMGRMQGVPSAEQCAADAATRAVLEFRKQAERLKP